MEGQGISFYRMKKILNDTVFFASVFQSMFFSWSFEMKNLQKQWMYLIDKAWSLNYLEHKKILYTKQIFVW